MTKPKNKRRVYLLLSLALLALALLSWLHAVYPLNYVYRVLAWQDASYDDYKKFPARLIGKSDRPYRFGRLEQEQAIAAAFERHPKIDQFDQFLEATGTTAFMVVKDADILYERYFHGHARDSVQSSFSVAKSLLSILVGIALEEGRVESVDDPITRYLPELASRDPRFAQITLKRLLTMRSGLKYSRAVNFPFVNADPPKTYYHPDLRSIALTESRIVEESGARFRYNNYNALLVGLILERATGTSVSAYFEEKVWRPIGAEYDASWSLDNRGFEKMESGFNARAVDFAKIGRLFLKKGAWEGVALVSERWVEESTQLGSAYEPEAPVNPRRWSYKYFWWGVPKTGIDDDFMAIGRFGQFIYISPKNNIVIVRNGPESREFSDPDWTELFHNAAAQL